jgi:hypothetical protein
MPLKLADILPDPDDILDLGPEELGHYILRVLDSWSPATNIQSSAFLNVSLGDPQIPNSGPYPISKRAELQEALRTAWTWLRPGSPDP